MPTLLRAKSGRQRDRRRPRLLPTGTHAAGGRLQSRPWSWPLRIRELERDFSGRVCAKRDEHHKGFGSLKHTATIVIGSTLTDVQPVAEVVFVPTEAPCPTDRRERGTLGYGRRYTILNDRKLVWPTAIDGQISGATDCPSRAVRHRGAGQQGVNDLVFVGWRGRHTKDIAFAAMCHVGNPYFHACQRLVM